MLPSVGNFWSEVTSCQTVSSVLQKLEMPVLAQRGLIVLGMWSLPRFLHVARNYKHVTLTVADLSNWSLDTNLFLHRTVPRDYWPAYRDASAKHGLSYTSWLVRQSSAPFTLAEAEAASKKMRNQNGGWIFDFYRSFGFNDGLYCPFRRWCFVFLSKRKLALSPPDRWLLSAAANAAVGQIEQIIKYQVAGSYSPRLKRPLTGREQEVLQQRAVLGDIMAVADVLGLSTRSIERHLADARRKLGVKETGQACLAAFKLGLIEY